MATCAAFDSSEPYVAHVLSFTDCHTLALAGDGWRALSPGSAWGAALTGLLTVFVALVGYRLLLDGRLGLRDGAGLALRLCLVLTLSSQWAAWQTLVFDVAIGAPDELAGSVLSPSGLGGQQRYGLASRIAGVDEAIAALVQPPQYATAATAATNAAAPAKPTIAPATQALPIDVVALIQQAARILTASALAALLAVRITLALLLALGPVFVGFALFETTQGIFASWARVLIGVVLGAVAVPAVLALELAVIEPQVAALVSEVDRNQVLDMVPDEIWVSTVVFGLVLISVLIAVIRAASGLRLRAGVWHTIERAIGGSMTMIERPGAQGAIASGVIATGEERSRARQVAQAALAMERREQRTSAMAGQRAGASPALAGTRELIGGDGVAETEAARPAAQQAWRHQRRQSAVARRRDGTP